MTSLKLALRATTADGLAFQDRGYQISPQYSFRIDCRRNPQDIWLDMHFKTRQHIRRAEEKFCVVSVEDPDAFVQFYEANVRKQGRTNHLNFETFGAVFRESMTRDSGEILAATWPDGAPTAMVYLVWGHGAMYYLLSSRASDSGDNGSVSLLIWEAIKRAHERGIVLDLRRRFLQRHGQISQRIWRSLGDALDRAALATYFCGVAVRQASTDRRAG